MYQSFAPAVPLQPFIESYWRLRSPAYRLAQNMVVDGYADLIFSFGVGYERRAHNSSQSLYSSNLDAQRDHPIAIIQQGAVDLVGVRFRPGGLSAFMPIPAHELLNHTPDLYTIFGTQVSWLEQQLYDAAEFMQQIALLNHFFLQRLCLYPQHAFAQHIAQHIQRHRGDITVRDLSTEVGYSIRTVDRLFRQYFGIYPKFYARIVRFRRALVLLAQAERLTLTDVAIACGYYDLAHFSKECSALAGMSAEACRQFVLMKTQAPPPLVEYLLEQNS